MRIVPGSDSVSESPIGNDGIPQVLAKTGRLPPVSIVVTPIGNDGRSPFTVERFLSYNFNSSILIPVDSFSFQFAAPDMTPFYNNVKEGDQITLFANNQPISTGVIDTVDIEVDENGGEQVTISGRDILSYLEEQDAIGLDSKPIYLNNISIQGLFNALKQNTKIKGLVTQDVPQLNQTFGTEPGESKLAALQRWCEPLNILFWADPVGNLVIGKPNFKQAPKGVIGISRERRTSNVISMKATYGAAAIPNIIIPVWSGQELVTDKLKEQALENNADGPKRLRTAGHRITKMIVTSIPQATSSAQDAAIVNSLRYTGSPANFLKAMAYREIARQNHKELIVQAVVPGHYFSDGVPYQVDQVYNIIFDRGSIDGDKMYLFQVDYTMNGSTGQRTNLYFCKLGSIVADARWR
jgi:prophage tail gpP-like protein